MKTLLMLGFLSLSLNAMATSLMRVTNLSGAPVQAIWQAGGCTDVYEDWTGSTQYTGCGIATIDPGYESTYEFHSTTYDRSVKVFMEGFDERIGYCDSMDNASITISGKRGEELVVTTNCP